MQEKKKDKSVSGYVLAAGFTVLCIGAGMFFDERGTKSKPRVIYQYEHIEPDQPSGGIGTHQGNPQGGPGGTPNTGTYTPGGPNVPAGDGWSEEYHTIAAEMAEKYGLTNLSPADKARYFPGVEGNPTADDWANLMGRMAYFESGHRPGLTYNESFTNQYGETVVSTGLTQISYASANGYRDSNGNRFNVTTQDLMDPRVNLEVTASILATQVGRHGVINGGSTGNWQGAATYWSIFRTGKL